LDCPVIFHKCPVLADTRIRVNSHIWLARDIHIKNSAETGLGFAVQMFFLL
jgi:hypothetical protein